MSRHIALVAVLVILAGCTAVTSSTPLSSARSSEPSASAEASAAPAPPVDGAQLPDVGCCIGLPIDAGRYVAPSFLPFAVSIKVGDGWRGLRSASEQIVAFLQGSNAIQHSTHYLALFGVDLDAAHNFLGELQQTDLLTVASSEPIEIGGLTGTRIDAVADPNPGELGAEERLAGSVRITAMTAITSPNSRWYTESVEARLQIYLLEATDTHMLIVYVEAPPGDFDALAATVEDALATLQVAPK